MSYGAGSNDIYMIKINNNGVKLWEKTFGDIGIDEGHSVICTSDKNLLITGVKQIASNSQLYLLKTDTAGNIIWEKTFGGALIEKGNDVKETYNGYVITGTTESYRASGIGGDVYLLKTDTAGNSLWYKAFGGAFDDKGNSLKIVQDSSIMMTGDFTQGGVTNFDIYIIKTDSLGNLQWEKKIGDNLNQEAYSIIQTTDLNFVITGLTYPDASAEDIYILKVDASGNVLWDRRYGNANHESANCIFEAKDTNLILTGIDNKEAFSMKTNRDGCFYFKPTLTADTVICDSVSQIISVGNYSSYLWSNGASTNNISVVTPSDYWVYVKDTNDCPAYSDTITLIDGTPWFSINTLGSDSLCYGQTSVLSTQITNYDSAYVYSYLWSTNDTIDNINADTTATYIVTVNNNNLSCPHSEQQIIFVALPVKQEFCLITQDTSLKKNKIQSS